MAAPARLHDYLSYRDAPAAIRFLADAFGFETVVEWPGEQGEIAHAELRLGDAVVMLATSDAAYEMAPVVGRSTGRGIYLAVDEVDQLFERATAAGARVLFAPESTEWGSRRFRVLDPEGYEWSFGTYRPGGG